MPLTQIGSAAQDIMVSANCRATTDFDSVLDDQIGESWVPDPLAIDSSREQLPQLRAWQPRSGMDLHGMGMGIPQRESETQY